MKEVNEVKCLDDLKEYLGTQFELVNPLYDHYIKEIGRGNFDLVGVSDLESSFPEWSEKVKEGFSKVHKFECSDIFHCVIACEPYLVSNKENTRVLGVGLNSVVYGKKVGYVDSGKVLLVDRLDSNIIPVVSMFCARHVLYGLTTGLDRGIMLKQKDGSGVMIKSIKEPDMNGLLKGEITVVNKYTGLEENKQYLSIDSVILLE